MLKRILLFPALCGFLLGAAPALAAESPTEVVRAAVDQVIGLLKDTSLDRDARRVRMREVIGERFDFRAMGQSILATNWRKASPPEQDRFVELFSQLLENTYVTAIESYTNETIEYTDETRKSDKVVVDTFIVTSTATRVPVSYKMRERDGEGWFVYDVVIEGISLVSNYRSSFASVVRQDGMAGLLADLERKIEELKNKQPG